MVINHSNAKDIVIKARAGLVMDNPFLGSLLLRLKLQEDPLCNNSWTSFWFDTGGNSSNWHVCFRLIKTVCNELNQLFAKLTETITKVRNSLWNYDCQWLSIIWQDASNSISS